MKFIIPFLFPIVLTAQNKENFEHIYTKTFLETSQKDFSKALFIADSLYSISENDSFEIKSLMLSASLYQQISDFKNAVKYALKAKEIADRTSDPIQNTKINGFLATQYRILKLYSQSNIYLKAAFSEVNKINNLVAKEKYLGMLLQEHAYYEIDQENYSQAIHYINLSIKHFSKEFAINKYFIGGNYQLLGKCYYNLNEYENALTHYKKALTYLEEFPNDYNKTLVYNGIALCYIENGNLTDAEKYINLAEKNSEKSEYLALKKESYKTYEKYYKFKNNPEKLIASKEKNDTISKIFNKNKDLFIENEQYRLTTENNALSKENSKTNYILLAILLLFIVFSISSYVYIKKIKQRIKDIQKDSHEFISTMNDQLKSKLFANREEVDIHPETEKKILMRLHNFEQTTLYNKNTISLASLSIYCQTNTKYLSQVINFHKNKNFTSYINQLRINYIVNELQNNPSYRKYKIAALSEMTGFSSPSKFSKAFKKEMKIATSEYIKNLEETNEALLKNKAS